MRPWGALLFLLVSAAAFAQTPTRTAQPSVAAITPPASIDRAIQAILPSLVRVSVIYLDQQAGREIKGQLSGSGTLISPDGYVVTNHHVAGRPRRIVCTLSTKEEVPADLIGTDPLSDIAVVKLHPAKPRKFPPSDRSRVTVTTPPLPPLAVKLNGRAAEGPPGRSAP